MKVKFEGPWFAPSASEQTSPLSVRSGQHFKKGVQEVPDELLKYLPKSAVVLDKNFVEDEDTAVDVTNFISADQANAEATDKVLKEAGLSGFEDATVPAKRGRGRPRKEDS